MLTKTNTYFCDQEAVREVYNYNGRKDTLFKGNVLDNPDRPDQAEPHERWANSGRNLRNVWVINSEATKEAHFATFASKLVEVCILASTSMRCCEVCGAPWAPVINRGNLIPIRDNADKKFYLNERAKGEIGYDAGSNRAKDGHKRSWSYENKFLGYHPTCDCSSQGTGCCLVLDPFIGTGRTAKVAESLGRDWVGIDLQQKYKKMADKTLGKEGMGI